MRVVIFTHSLISDWGHGSAHFLRGVASELVARGHEVRVFEPRDAWSVRNLLAEHGHAALLRFARAYPQLSSTRYDLARLDLDEALDGASLVLVHEWNEPALVERLGEKRRARRGTCLLFHDTRHRAAADGRGIASLDLSHFDGVLASGSVIRDSYLRRGWTARAFVWHEAADVRVFRPLPGVPKERDVLWIGDWRNGERRTELRELLLGPVHALRLSARIHGVRYPFEAEEELRRAGVELAGWIPNFEVPDAFARARVTVHIPHRPFARARRGVPTIRPFEALASGIPLVSAPWDDVEALFRPGEDYLVARTGAEMEQALSLVLQDPGRARALAECGLATVLARHTCGHRVDELLAIHRLVAGSAEETRPAAG